MAVINLGDENLIAALKNKEGPAFETLMNIYGDKILRLCYLILRDLNLAEDVTQEIFIQIYKNIEKFKGASSLYTWIYKITVNKCRNQLRRNGTYCSIDEALDLKADINIEDEVLNSVAKQKIKDLVFSLQAPYREVIILFYFEQLSIKEICSILEENENTVKSKLRRARNILKETIMKEEI